MKPPEVQRLLQFDTIQNLYYPEAFAPVEATTVEEFNQNTDNNVEHVYYHYGDDYQSMVVRLCAYAVVILGDVYFRRGKFQPESEEGRKLLTHELTHVAQNKSKEFVDHRTRKELEEEAEFNERTAESESCLHFIFNCIIQCKQLRTNQRFVIFLMHFRFKR